MSIQVDLPKECFNLGEKIVFLVICEEIIIESGKLIISPTGPSWEKTRFPSKYLIGNSMFILFTILFLIAYLTIPDGCRIFVRSFHMSTLLYNDSSDVAIDNTAPLEKKTGGVLFRPIIVS